jgi:hypothetical protein
LTPARLSADLYSLACRRLASVGSRRELSLEIAGMCVAELQRGTAGHRFSARVHRAFADKHGSWDSVSAELDAIIAVTQDWALRPGSGKVVEGLG